MLYSLLYNFPGIESYGEKDRKFIESWHQVENSMKVGINAISPEWTKSISNIPVLLFAKQRMQN